MSEQGTEEQRKPLSLLASEGFGDRFKGEVKEQEEAPQGELEEPLEGEAREPVPSEPEETEQADNSEDGTIEEDQPEDESKGTTIEEFAEYLQSEHGLELSIDDLMIDLKVNGKSTQKSLAELRAVAQKIDAADDILESAKTKAKQERESFNSEIEHRNREVSEKLSTAAMIVQHAEKILSNDRQKVDWETLRTENPSEYSALREDFKDREQEIYNLKSNASGAYQQWQAQSAQESEQAQRNHMARESELLMSAIPEWADETRAAAEKTKTAEFLMDFGFTSEEISQAADHRLILLARNAMLYHSQSNTVETVKKKISKIPKVLKPGTPKSADQLNSTALSGLQAKLNGSGTIEDAFNLMKARRK